MPKGRVFKTTGSWYLVQDESGCFYDCRVKGNLRLAESRNTNPVAVGDWVDFYLEEKTQKGVIEKIFPRQNYIIRRSTNLSKKHHILASNINQAVLVISLKTPKTLTGFIDRFLVTTEAYQIPAIIIINKTDIYDSDLLEEAERLGDIYKSIGYKVLQTSVVTGLGLQELRNMLLNKTSLFSGHSGVGKSSLLNKMIPGLNLKTGEVSLTNQKGKHTTTFAQMLAINNTTYVIDTPGIKSFGIIDFTREEVARYFPEMLKVSHNCKYYNCTHINEPDCKVIQYVQEGKIAGHRYKNYLNLYESDDYSPDWE